MVYERKATHGAGSRGRKGKEKLVFDFEHPEDLEKDQLPEIDWSKHGLLSSPIRDQKKSYVCWAIAAATVLEMRMNMIRLRGEDLIVPSFLEPVDWVPDKYEKDNNRPLTRSKRVWEYIMGSGVSEEKFYEHVDRVGLLPLAENKRPKQGVYYANVRKTLKIKGYVEEEIEDRPGAFVEKKLLAALATGPVVGVLKVYNPSMAKWSGHGVYTWPSRAERRKKVLYHSIAIVGYGTDVNDDGTVTNYFRVRNSYGEHSWDHGYANKKSTPIHQKESSLFQSFSYPTLFDSPYGDVV